MRTRLFVGLLLTSLSMTPSAAQQQKERCGTRQPSFEEIEQIEQQVTRARGKVKATVTIPVWFHVIDQGDGFANGQLTDAMIQAQMRVLQDSYGGRTGGASSPFGFRLAGEAPEQFGAHRAAFGIRTRAVQESRALLFGPGFERIHPIATFSRPPRRRCAP